MLETPLIKAVTPAPRPLPFLSPKSVEIGPVKIESEPQLPNPMRNKLGPKKHWRNNN